MRSHLPSHHRETRLAHCTEMLEGLAEGMVTAQTSAMEARRPHGAKAKAVVSVAVEAPSGAQPHLSLSVCVGDRRGVCRSARRAVAGAVGR